VVTNVHVVQEHQDRNEEQLSEIFLRLIVEKHLTNNQKQKIDKLDISVWRPFSVILSNGKEYAAKLKNYRHTNRLDL
jgi:hypothetical protein